MEIGSKIKKSRIDAKLTQEQAAETLGISRQTISNWENEKSYPDIVSVLKMSDLYGVSLDYLLKGDSPMKNYLDYIMFLLSVYASYGMRENSIFNQIDLQTITLFFIGAIASVIGIVLGYAFFTVEKNTPKSE